MIDIIHQADVIYQDASNLGSKLALAIEGTQVQDTNMVLGTFTCFKNRKGCSNILQLTVPGVFLLHLCVETSQPSDFLANYGKYLAGGVTSGAGPGLQIRGNSLPASDQVCLNHMFTHLSMTNNVVGVANIRAFCETRLARRGFWMLNVLREKNKKKMDDDGGAGLSWSYCLQTPGLLFSCQ